MRATRGVTVLAVLSALLVSLTALPSEAARDVPAVVAKPTTRASENPQPTLQVPVNVVLVGFSKAAVGPGLTAQLASSGDSIVRNLPAYGVVRPVGIHYDYDYRLLEASAQVTDQFFEHQLSVGRDGAVTSYQAAYNAQAGNRLDVTGPVLSNDAVATQKWLDQNVAGPMGIDPQRSYTVYLVNWWGRPDFRFHNYRVATAVDPDTGIDWANDTVPFPYIPSTHWDQSALSAWGGTSSRSWFWDISAGPDFYSQNWDVDHADLDLDGQADYRIPPVWEYAIGGYRIPSALAADLGRVVRYVAVNLLFTSSPIYDPMGYQPANRTGLRLHSTVFEHEPTINGNALTKSPKAAALLRTLEPWLRFSTSHKVVKPAPPDITSAVQSFLFDTPQPPGGCWEDYGFWAAQLVCMLIEAESTYLPRVQDTVIPSYTFTGSQDELALSPVQGIALDNLIDGGRAATYQFIFPDLIAYGRGNTLTTAHEVGHELGASHPHDGYDSKSGQLYSARGNRFFSWLGDQSDSLMGYTWLARQFSVFDKDNIARQVYAGYVARTEGPGQQTSAQAALLASAAQAFQNWNFRRAAALARVAWSKGAASLTLRGVRPQAARPRDALPTDLEEPRRVDLGEEGSGARRPGA